MLLLVHVVEGVIGVAYMYLRPQFPLPPYPSSFFRLMEGCQQSFHALQKMNTLTTVPVHKNGHNVDDDRDDSAMTELMFL